MVVLFYQSIALNEGLLAWAKLKNGQNHHEKVKFDVGLTYLVFSLEGAQNAVLFYLKYFNSTFRSYSS